MKKIRLTFFITLAATWLCFGALLIYQPGAAAKDASPDLTTRIQKVFVGKAVKIHDYDEQLKEVTVGSEHFFTSHDGRYVFAGPIYDTQRKIELVSDREAIIRRKLLDAQPSELFVSYPSTAQQQHEITVVTDVDCAYCRKFHQSLSTLNKQGVSLNYVMLPRAGVNSASYAKTLNALCSNDAGANITRLMAGHTLEKIPRACDSDQLKNQMDLAASLSIRSTPSFILPNGKLHVGLLSPEALVSLLDNSNPHLTE